MTGPNIPLTTNESLTTNGVLTEKYLSTIRIFLRIPLQTSRYFGTLHKGSNVLPEQNPFGSRGPNSTLTGSLIMRLSSFAACTGTAFKTCLPTPNEDQTKHTEQRPYFTPHLIRSMSGIVPPPFWWEYYQTPNLLIPFAGSYTDQQPEQTPTPNERPTGEYYHGGIFGCSQKIFRYDIVRNKRGWYQPPTNPKLEGFYTPEQIPTEYAPIVRATPERTANPLVLGNDSPTPNLAQTNDGSGVRYTNNPTTLDKVYVNAKQTRTRYAPSGGSFCLDSILFSVAFGAGPNIPPMHFEQHPNIFYTLFVIVRKWAVSPDGMRMDPNNSQTDEFVHDGCVRVMSGDVTPTKDPNKLRKLTWWAKRETRIARTNTSRNNVVTKVRLNWVPNTILTEDSRTEAGNIGQIGVREMIGEDTTIPERRALYLLTPKQRANLARIQNERRTFSRMKAEHRRAMSKLTIAQTNTKPRLGVFSIDKGVWDTLTATQQRVARMLMDGKDYRTIAKQVFDSEHPNTVTRTLAELRDRANKLIHT